MTVVNNPVSGLQGSFPSVSVHNAGAPTSFTDLDLSAHTGAKVSMVFFMVVNLSGDATQMNFYFRRNGETGVDSDQIGFNRTSNIVDENKKAYLACITDSAGIVEWMSDQAKGCQITLEGWFNV